MSTLPVVLWIPFYEKYTYIQMKETRTVECETVEEFMNVLHFVRDNCPEDMLTYTNPLDDK